MLPKRFMEKVEVSGGCWIWTASKNSYGYGRIKHKGNTISAHRFSFEQTNGSIPLGMSVLHKCDIRDCVNPDHLYIGTHEQNMLDMKMKDRAVRGKDHPHAVLSKKMADEIRGKYVPRKYSIRKLAAEYRVGTKAIQRVLKNMAYVKPDRYDHVE